jgi:phasin family protein
MLGICANRIGAEETSRAIEKLAGWSENKLGRAIAEEEGMTKESQSYIDMLRNFASHVGLPQVDVEELIETNRKNVEAPAASAKVAAGAAQSMAQKQREVLEAGLREAQALARDLKPLSNAQENLAKQMEFARKVFDISLQGAREAAEKSKQSTAEAVKIVQERVKASLEEFPREPRAPRGRRLGVR